MADLEQFELAPDLWPPECDPPLFMAEEIRQLTYCPRVYFFRRVLHVPNRQTFKMQRGTDYHTKEIRSQGGNHGIVPFHQFPRQAPRDPVPLPPSGRYFNVSLADPERGLFGVLDILVVEEEGDGGDAYPVELKMGRVRRGDLGAAHKAQLAAQALLVEKTFHCAVNKVRVEYVDHDNEAVVHYLTVDDKQAVLALVKQARMWVDAEEMPPPTPHAAKCTDCEFLRYCFRV